MFRHYKLYGRRKGGTWGKPHKSNRKAANRGLRTLLKRNANAVKKED